jgi:hypothetical protein
MGLLMGNIFEMAKGGQSPPSLAGPQPGGAMVGPVVEVTPDLLDSFGVSAATIGLFTGDPNYGEPETMGGSSGLADLKRLCIGRVVFKVVTDETYKTGLDAQKHPVESRKQITDHAWRNPVTLSFSGLLVGVPLTSIKHKEALIELQSYREKAQPIVVICDFPPGRYMNMLLVDMSVSRKHPFPTVYEVSLTLEEINFVDVLGYEGGADTLAIPVPNMDMNGLSFAPDSPNTELGFVQDKQWGVPGEESQLGAAINALGGSMDGLSFTAKQATVKSAVSELKAKGDPNADLIARAVEGDPAAVAVLGDGAALFPGAQNVFDTAFAAIPKYSVGLHLAPTAPVNVPISTAESAAAAFLGQLARTLGAQAFTSASPMAAVPDVGKLLYLVTTKGGAR